MKQRHSNSSLGIQVGTWIWLTTIVLPGPGAMGAEDSPGGTPAPPPAQSIPAAESDKTPAAPLPGETPAPAPAAVRSTLPPEWNRRLGETQRLLEQLEQQSRSAFDRGLMPLGDHIDQLTLALQTRVAIAALQNRPQERRAAVATHAAQLKQIVENLAALQQPGAQGYLADLSYAKSLYWEAEAELARLEQAPDREAEARTRWAAATREQYERRLADFQVGEATAFEMGRAIQQLQRFRAATSATKPQESGARDTAPLDVPLVGERELNVTATRVDSRLAFQSALAQQKAWQAQEKGNAQSALNAFREAERRSHEQFEAQLKFYQVGTASLFQLASGLKARQDLSHAMEMAGLSEPQPARASRQADMQRLQELAQSVSDLRGRNAADVLFAQALPYSSWYQEQLRERARAERDAAPASVPPAPVPPAPSAPAGPAAADSPPNSAAPVP